MSLRDENADLDALTLDKDHAALLDRSAAMTDDEFYVRRFDIADELGWSVDQVDYEREARRTNLNASAGSVVTYEARRLSEVVATPIKWLWSKRFATGKTNTIAGEPGLGKTQLTILMIAVVTTGGIWPDGTRAPLGNVVMISGEDDAADTILPRLIAAGADLSRVYILDWVPETSESGERILRSFDIARDADRLLNLVEDIGGGVRLIVIDPISAYFGKIDSHKASDVRAALQPLSSLVAKIDACLLLVTHLNKGSADGSAMSRVSGSGSIVAASRSAWLVAQHPQNEDRRVITPLKNNIGNDQEGFAYTIESVDLGEGIETSRVVFDETPITIRAEDVLKPASSDDVPTALDEAIDFLKDELRAPKTSKHMQASAKAAGISWRTVERAKRKIGVVSQKDGQNGVWHWKLPKQNDGEEFI